MSIIPPNWLGSIAQTQGAAARATEQKRQEEAAQGDHTGASFAEKLQDVIENTDRDSQVYSDAEGSGSEGRPFEAPAQEAEEAEKPPDGNEGNNASGGLDLQA